jgi:uncharacterized protein YdeI (BOF family)
MIGREVRLTIFGGFSMKKKIQSLWFLSALVVFLSVGISLNAQDSTPQTKTPDAQSQPAPPSQAPDAGKSAPSDSQAPSASSAATQSFTGTILKSGDKYMFQDADTGNTYDIDHQDEVQKFEGKKVKVHGTLDASTKTIHVQ